MSWLIDTTVWTAVLLALVLVLRRPVARQFGSQAAYALWALPFMRLLLPPLVLPAWLAPAKLEPVMTETAYLVVNLDPSATAPVEATRSFDWLVLAPAFWLTGAAIFLAWRFAAYFRMRRELLDGARPVGQCGRVRLVESSAVASPLAFGVLDKVVALPEHFMAQYDRRARDLALEHELAHHRGHDLAVNFAVQPLFALHWFNPLGWLGWRAMRRDQEAACDARVIAARGAGERAAYASLIAEFAAGPKLALAAPMACPVLGDKSIVHRLRSLAMSDISRRRRFAGRALLAAAALALPLPLTASISYAEIPATPEAPESPIAPTGPAAPLAPQAPSPPPAPSAPEAVVAIAPRTPGEHRVRVVRIENGKVRDVDLRKVRRDGKVVYFADGQEWNEEEFEAQMEALDARLEGLGEELELQFENMPKIDEKQIRLIERRAERMASLAPEVRMSCEGEGATSETVTPEGKRIIRICERRIVAGAAIGLQRARDQIARNSEMSDNVRAEVLESLDREIARIRAE